MFPAPAAGTPFETMSPMAIANIWAAGARKVRNEYVPVAGSKSEGVTVIV
jgi:hypothetical protein